MNKFVIAALALTAASTLSYAGSETKEWSGLDRDIESLRLNQAAPAATGFGVGGYVRSRYANSSDVDVDGNPATNDDLGGFNIDNARLIFDGSQGEYGVHIELDAAGGSATLLDAFATFRIAEGITGQMGQFRAPFLWSALIDDNHLVLLDRTFSGNVFASRDQGLQVSGVFDQFGWWVALQNGQDGVADEYAWTARVQFNALGAGVGWQEGAYGASDETSLTVGAGYTDDGTPSDGAAFCIDVGFTQGAFSAHAELVDYDDDVTQTPGLNTSTGVISSAGIAATADAETPWSATVGYMITPNEYEIVGRYEDIDDTNDTTAWVLGVNRYVAGHNAKWTLQFSSSDSDNTGIEADTLALGLTVGV